MTCMVASVSSDAVGAGKPVHRPGAADTTCPEGTRDPWPAAGANPSVPRLPSPGAPRHTHALCHLPPHLSSNADILERGLWTDPRCRLCAARRAVEGCAAKRTGDPRSG